MNGEGRPAGLRVALVDPGDFTPPYDEALARGLRQIGCRVRLWGMAGRPAADPDLDKGGHFYRPLAGPLGRLLPRAAHPLVKGLVHPFDLARLRSRLERDGVDIVHLQWVPLPLLDLRWIVRLRRRVPVLLTVHDTRPYHGVRGGPVVWGLERLLRAVDALIVHTEDARRRLIAAGHPPRRVHTIPHGLLELAPPDPPPLVGHRPIRLLLFGAIKPYKGVDVLLEALARLAPDRRTRLRVTIAGRPFVDLTPLHAVIARHDLGRIVELRPGFVADAEVSRLIAEADVMLLPYRSIDASGVSMSAVAAGRPVIASALPGFVELFGRDRGAILVPPEDPAALARAIESLVDEPQRLVALGRAMRELRAAIPSWTEIARRTLAVYEQLRAERRHGVAAGDPARALPGTDPSTSSV